MLAKAIDLASEWSLACVAVLMLLVHLASEVAVQVDLARELCALRCFWAFWQVRSTSCP